MSPTGRGTPRIPMELWGKLSKAVAKTPLTIRDFSKLDEVTQAHLLKQRGKQVDSVYDDLMDSILTAQFPDFFTGTFSSLKIELDKLIEDNFLGQYYRDLENELREEAKQEGVVWNEDIAGRAHNLNITDDIVKIFEAKKRAKRIPWYHHKRRW